MIKKIPILYLEKLSSNNTFYTKDCLDEFLEKNKNKSIPVTLGFNEVKKDINIKDVIGTVTDFFIKDNTLFGTLSLIKNKNEFLYYSDNILNDNIVFRAASRCVAKENNNGEIIIDNCNITSIVIINKENDSFNNIT